MKHLPKNRQPVSSLERYRVRRLHRILCMPLLTAPSRVEHLKKLDQLQVESNQRCAIPTSLSLTRTVYSADNTAPSHRYARTCKLHLILEYAAGASSSELVRRRLNGGEYATAGC